jgi:hypothetical protein
MTHRDVDGEGVLLVEHAHYASLFGREKGQGPSFERGRGDTPWTTLFRASPRCVHEAYHWPTLPLDALLPTAVEEGNAYEHLRSV